VTQLPAGRGQAGERLPWLSAAAVGALALGVYVATLAPTITWAHQGADGGDLITAAATLGVPHPPGYPLYVLLGHVISRVPLPMGELALRFNLLSAISAAGAAAALTLAISQLASPFAGLVGGLTFSFGPILWSQALIAEVYAPHALLISAWFLALLLVRAGDKHQLGVGLLWGLAWTMHLSSALLLPLALWWNSNRAQAWRGRGRFLLGLLLGLAPFLLLPLLAVRRPVINWGNPVTPGRWWWLVSGALYRGYVLRLPLADWPGRLAALARYAVEGFTWPGLALVLWGAAQFAREKRRLLLVLALSAGLVMLYALGYNAPDSHVLLIPAWMIATVLLGVGVARLVQRVPRVRALRPLFLLIPLALLLTGWSDVSLRADREAADFGQRVMRDAPPDALVYTATDAHTFTLWYYRHAIGLRPDLTVVDRDMLAEEWYQVMLQAQDGRWPEMLDGRPVCTLSHAGALACDG
jgi:hypothetical protein